jgi:hypothetical protein
LHAVERVPGTKVSLAPPDDFESTTQYPGFAMKSTGATIIVNEMPAPFSELAKGMTSENLATRGMKLIEKTNVDVASREGKLLYVRQSAGGIEFLKWMLLFGTEKESVMLLATFPAEFEKDLREILRKAILSATWDLNAKVDPAEGLTFSVKESADLKVAGKIGNMLALTRNGVMPQTNPAEPLFVVGSSASEDWTVPGDKAVYARERFIKAGPLSDATLTSERSIKFDGLSGYLLEAEGRDKKTGVALYAMQGMLFTTDGYYVLQAFVGVEEKEKYSKVFLTILKSFKRVE